MIGSRYRDSLGLLGCRAALGGALLLSALASAALAQTAPPPAPPAQFSAPGLPISPQRYERFVAAVAGLDKAASVDETIRLTLPG